MKNREDSMVSVIVPCYNQARFLTETLDSVLAQSHQNWECIIVNDGSTDETEAVALRYGHQDARFIYCKKENGGLSSARNAGLAIAKGDYIQFLDSDDILLPEKFSFQIQSMTDENVDVSIAQYRLFMNNVQNQFDIDRSTAIFDCSIEGILYRWNIDFVFPPVCYFVKHDFLLKNAILFEERVKAIEDWVFMVSVVLASGVVKVEETILALYRRHDNNMSNNLSLMSYSLLKANFIVFDLLPKEYRDEFAAKKSLYLSEKFKQSFTNVKEQRKANSIDYKLGAFLLFPLHKMSSFIKKIRK